MCVVEGESIERGSIQADTLLSRAIIMIPPVDSVHGEFKRTLQYTLIPYISIYRYLKYHIRAQIVVRWRVHLKHQYWSFLFIPLWSSSVLSSSSSGRYFGGTIKEDINRNNSIILRDTELRLPECKQLWNFHFPKSIQFSGSWIWRTLWLRKSGPGYISRMWSTILVHYCWLYSILLCTLSAMNISRSINRKLIYFYRTLNAMATIYYQGNKQEVAKRTEIKSGGYGIWLTLPLFFN